MPHDISRNIPGGPRPRRPLRFALLAALCVVPLSARAAAVAAPPAPAADCVRCHKSIAARPFLHGPVGVGMCSLCHGAEKKDAAGRHSFVPTKPQPELCLSCHDGLRAKVESSKFGHGAIDAGGCTACHDPHGSGQKHLLKGKSPDETCSACHDPKTRGEVVHPPAKASCSICHDPHGSDKAKLLKAELPALCLDCHQKSRGDFAGKHVHGPVQAGCPSCHDPHSAPRKSLLRADGKKDLCLTCHEDVARKIKAVSHPHPAVEKDGCTACHVPHTSDQARLLKMPLQQLCVTCHKDTNSELKAKLLHGPVARGQCQDCHDAHGSDNPKILKIFFPENFYNSYKDGLYAVCFNCHEKDIAREPQTTKLTNFRNGDKNLHYVHVHSEKGRSCKSCHAVHGGDQEKHVREGVPFGSWNLPIKYTRTSGGGTCIVGCHNPKSYDRAKAVVNP